MRCASLLPFGWVFGAFLLNAGSALAEGDAEAGARVFRACAACHSLAPGRHLTGPSLAGFWHRKAGSIEGFTRYSSALKTADIVWDERTLDAWIADPQAMVPGNRMTFRGIQEPQARADLIAYLKTATTGNVGAQAAQDGGMMQGPTLRDLKALGPTQQVAGIRYCGDTYHVTTVAGETVPLWEFNLRFKTDSSEQGPPKGHPVLLPASMMGDRAFVIFADPNEISRFIEAKC